MAKIKAGIVGCGGIAMGKHLPSATKAGGVKFTAFCDIIPERAEQAKKQYGSKDAAVYTDYKKLLADGSIDVIYVCTPNNSHCQITVDALESGKHVMCEKPMAVSYDEAKKMTDAARRTGKLLTVGYQNRYRPDSRYLKAECQKGTLGDIYFAKARAIRRRAVPTWGVFLDAEKQGGGPLIDIGTHALDLTLHMMDNYSPKYAVGTVYHKLNEQRQAANAWGDWDVEKFTVEDSAFGFVVMENGATIMLESSWALNVADVGEAQTLLCGTAAGADMFDGLRINGVANNTQYILRPSFEGGGVDFYDGVSADPAVMEAKTFIDAVSGKGKLLVTAEQAAEVTRILEGIYISARTGQPYYFK